MAHPTAFKIVVTGKGGHGSQPQHAVDPVLTAAHVIIALNSIVSRNVASSEQAVLSVLSDPRLTRLARTHPPLHLCALLTRSCAPVCGGTQVTMVHGGEVSNVIPDKVTLQGTIRDLAPAVCDVMYARVKTIVKGVCDTYGATGTVELDGEPPPAAATRRAGLSHCTTRHPALEPSSSRLLSRPLHRPPRRL